MGIKEARHEIVLLTDATVFPPVNSGFKKCRMDTTMAPRLYWDIALTKKTRLLNKLIRFETFHSALQYLSYALAGQPYMGVGRNLSYKKELFLRNKGFSSINHVPGRR